MNIKLNTKSIQNNIYMFFKPRTHIKYVTSPSPCGSPPAVSAILYQTPKKLIGGLF